MKIENGYVVGVKQNEEKENWVRQYFPSKSIKYRISHLSIGFNENATNPFLPLELGKMRGMTNFSIRLGEKTKDSTLTNIWPGNFPSPNTYLEIDGELVFKNGRLLI